MSVKKLPNIRRRVEKEREERSGESGNKRQERKRKVVYWEREGGIGRRGKGEGSG